MRSVVKDTSRSSPPGSPAFGDQHIVFYPGSGGWSGKGKKIALYLNDWVYRDPQIGDIYINEDTGREVYFNGSAWYEICGPFHLWYSGSHATPVSGSRVGRFLSSSTNPAADLESANHYYACMTCEFAIYSGTTSGTYDIDCILQAVGGSNYPVKSLTGLADNQWNRGHASADGISSPLALIGGTSGNRFTVGWENKGTSADALDTQTHTVTVSGYIVEKLV